MPLLVTMGPSLSIRAVVSNLELGSSATFIFYTSGAVGPVILELANDTLPSEWTFTDNTDGTAQLQVTSVAVAGVFTFTVQATDEAGTPVTITLSLTVFEVVADPQTLALSGDLPDATENSYYSASLTRDGGTAPFTYSISAGALPTGLSINSSTGLVTGEPGVGSPAYFASPGELLTFTVQVMDSLGNTATREQTITVIDGPVSGDPLYADTLLILNMQGVNNGTVFTDEAATPGTFTAAGGAKTTTSGFLYGTSCGTFDGSGDAVQRDTAAVSLASSEPWTVEYLFKTHATTGAGYNGGLTGLIGLHIRIQNGGAGSVEEVAYYDSDVNFRALSSGRSDKTILIRDATKILLADTWYCVVLVSDPGANQFKAWLSEAGGAFAQVGTTQTAKPLRIWDVGMSNNSSTPSNEWKGLIQQLRVTNAVRTPEYPTDLFPDYGS